jgi:methionine-rich copper-binding protein CopC
MRAATALLALIFVALLAPPAASHTDLVDVRPAQGQRLRSWPDEVVLTFSEAVDPSLSAVSVAVDGARATAVPVRQGRMAQQLNASLEERAPDPVPTSAYVVGVSYRVTSADGHPISGTTSFRVTPPSSGASPPEASGSATQSPPPTPTPTSTPDSTAGPEPSTRPGTLAWILGGTIVAVVASAVVSRRSTRLRAAAEQDEQQ